MSTVKQWVLDRSILPKTGIHTMKEHLLATMSNNSVIATVIGGIQIDIDTQQLSLVSSTTELEVSTSTSELSIDNKVYEIIIEDTDTVALVLDDCG